MVPADLIAYSANGADEGPIGTGINFAAQVVDIDVDNVGDGFRMHSPHLLDDAGTGNGVARIAQQKFQ